jgi:hypothetical protein
MNWRPIDFQGIIHLDRRVIDSLDQYLQEKETRLAYHILHLMQPIYDEPFKPVLPLEASLILKLSDAVEGLTKQIRQLSKERLNHQPSRNVEQIILEINSALWEWTEVLEGCVIELFQQIKQVNIDRWHRSLSKVVLVVKEMLIHRIDDLMWTIRRLENPLKELRLKNQSLRGWKRWTQAWKPVLDPILLKNLLKSEKFLQVHYEAFSTKYAEYVRLNIKVENHLDKMKTFPVLALLDVHDQNFYVDVFRLLKFLELNVQDKGVLAEEIVYSIRHLASIDAVIKVFKIYERGLSDAFFNSSHELKTFSQEKQLSDLIERLRKKLFDYQRELKQLLRTMNHYRDFVLNTHPNPYIRSRWGFTEWTVGPEPEKARKLLKLIYQAERLKAWYDQFLISMNQDFTLQQQQETQILQNIDRILHEMGQPLISKVMMRNRVDQLLNHLNAYNEVASLREESIQEVNRILSKAMREDWKYHVLYEFSLFHEIFQIHRGLQKLISDPSHAFRLERFRHLCQQIEEWIQTEDLYTHIHEIELDRNDMKIYLQDFLASVQRLAKERTSNPFLDESIEKLRQQLLEYRYLFGQFFYYLQTRSPDGQQFRNQFIFIDQYFESVEILLHELTLSWEGKEFRS